MFDNKIAKDFNAIKAVIEQKESEKGILYYQELLEKEVEKLTFLINQYVERKEENSRIYNEQLQENLAEIFNEASSEVQKVEEICEVKNRQWGETEQKMNVFCQLRSNVRQIYTLKKSSK